MEISVSNQTPAKRVVKWVLTVLILAVLLLAVWYMAGERILAAKPDGEKYQAVFLTNGQVYFGKLKLSGSTVVLKDIYYLQVTQDLQATGNTQESTTTPPTASNNNQQQRINLVKLGQELHGPEDTMYIERDKILFWENLKDDSRVVESINQAKQ